MPLWMMAFWKSPSFWGLVSWAQTLPPPADWPPMVMLSGSPPKAAIFYFAQRIPARRSRWPKFVGASGCVAVSSGWAKKPMTATR